MKCPYCQQEHLDTLPYCPITGKSLLDIKEKKVKPHESGVLCPTCGKKFREGAQYCESCGFSFSEKNISSIHQSTGSGFIRIFIIVGVLFIIIGGLILTGVISFSSTEQPRTSSEDYEQETQYPNLPNGITPSLTVISSMTSSSLIAEIPTLTQTEEATITPTVKLNPSLCQEVAQSWVSPLDGAILNCIPAGGFVMGSDSADEDEKPAHQVFLDGFWIDKYEVTNKQFVEFLNHTSLTVKENGEVLNREHLIIYDLFSSDVKWKNRIVYEYGSFSVIPGFENHPVSMVTWYGATDYCSSQDRRLPTEAEWEKASHGDTPLQYPWSNIWNSFYANSALNDPYNDTSPIGSFLEGASPYGVMDMAGNVVEWVHDWYSKDYYDQSPENNPINSMESGNRAMRGGSWISQIEWFLRTTDRNWSPPDDYGNGLGFRCAY